ncbi:hypothetical protein P152DRAFT_126530 [Eremomyces bilateralis CBS 781.70]|uniref:LicD/FKTN/FKRP nucleotidyltransferase domain-containing protein n=1 Tax=Eremomyces bilateralis CBS 781.70 TaxID=1392243 RepID=A0A6G1GEP8_9PEZI|nr:uncharacterized protein P152DRAFT_126530 [Eremomyces bilateralis CBS 781.70]KAF1816504.1 hypothetical protein P152DRAFT_126530 [Eremomyces bilateralis CBS 781.70]
MSVLSGVTLILAVLFISIRLVHAIPQLQKRDADFWNVRTYLTEDNSDRGPTPDGGQKYFHEAKFHHHYDGRFAARELLEAERHYTLRLLVKTYLRAMDDLGAETWIMHGTLLGWWWNGHIMPWDTDIDVQVSESGIEHLAGYYNMTVHQFQIPRAPWGEEGSSPDGTTLPHVSGGTVEVASGLGGGLKVPDYKPEMMEEERVQHRRYLLEINPFYKNDSIADKWNVIDGRWIDMSTGLFIDITTLRTNISNPKIMYCKDKHRYLADDIFPLRDSKFEGEPAKIPFAYSQLLQEEYGPLSLIWKMFMGHKFDERVKQWLIDPDWADRVRRNNQRLRLLGATRRRPQTSKPKTALKEPSRFNDG